MEGSSSTVVPLNSFQAALASVLSDVFQPAPVAESNSHAAGTDPSKDASEEDAEHITRHQSADAGARVSISTAGTAADAAADPYAARVAGIKQKVC
jgi:hypothetical protein